MFKLLEYKSIHTFTDIYRHLQTFRDISRHLQTFTDISIFFRSFQSRSDFGFLPNFSLSVFFFLYMYLPTIIRIHTQSQMLIIQFFLSQIKDFYLVEQTIISGQQHLALPICIVYDIVVSAVIALWLVLVCHQLWNLSWVDIIDLYIWFDFVEYILFTLPGS